MALDLGEKTKRFGYVQSNSNKNEALNLIGYCTFPTYTNDFQTKPSSAIAEERKETLTKDPLKESDNSIADDAMQ